MKVFAKLFGLVSATTLRSAQNDEVVLRSAQNDEAVLRSAHNDEVVLRSAHNDGGVSSCGRAAPSQDPHGTSITSSCAVDSATALRSAQNDGGMSSCAVDSATALRSAQNDGGMSSCGRAQARTRRIQHLQSLLAAALFALPLAANALSPMNETQLSGVTGREGVAMDFDYGLNAFKEDTTVNGHDYKRGDPLTPHLLDSLNFAAGDDITGTTTTPGPTTVLNGCQQVSSGPNLCSMAIGTNNRPGMWLVLKDMSAVLKMHNFWIDGGRITSTGGTSPVYTLSLPGSKTFTSPFTLSNANADETRFYDAAGNCLLAGKSAGSCNMAGLPLLVMQYDPLNAANNKADVTWNLHIGRIAIQGDTGTAPNKTPAYMTDQGGSFMSYQVSDFNQNEAKIHYGGRVLMFGF